MNWFINRFVHNLVWNGMFHSDNRFKTLKTIFVMVFVISTILNLLNESEHERIQKEILKNQTIAYEAKERLAKAKEIEKTYKPEIKIDMVDMSGLVYFQLNGKEFKAEMIGCHIPTKEEVEKSPNYKNITYKQLTEYLQTLIYEKATLEYDIIKKDVSGVHQVYLWMYGKLINQDIIEKGFAVYFNKYDENNKYDSLLKRD